jgi:hypothetical protein
MVYGGGFAALCSHFRGLCGRRESVAAALWRVIKSAAKHGMAAVKRAAAWLWAFFAWRRESILKSA